MRTPWRAWYMSPQGTQEPGLTPIQHKHLKTRGLPCWLIGSCTGEPEQGYQEAGLPRGPREQLKGRSPCSVGAGSVSVDISTGTAVLLLDNREQAPSHLTGLLGQTEVAQLHLCKRAGQGPQHSQLQYTLPFNRPKTNC